MHMEWPILPDCVKIQQIHVPRFLQWSDFGKKVRKSDFCTILVRIWWDF